MRPLAPCTLLEVADAPNAANGACVDVGVACIPLNPLRLPLTGVPLLRRGVPTPSGDNLSPLNERVKGELTAVLGALK
jgi:hypothetical protein